MNDLPRRWQYLRLADFLASRGQPQPTRPGRVLVLRLFGIGDALIYKLAVDAYRDTGYFRGHEFTFLLDFKARAVADLCFGSNRTLFMDERKFARNFLYRLRQTRKLRAGGFSTVLCPMYFRSPLVADALMGNLGARERIAIKPLVSEKWQRSFDQLAGGTTREIAYLESRAWRPYETPPGSPVPVPHELERALDFHESVSGEAAAPPSFNLALPRDSRAVSEMPDAPFAVINEKRLPWDSIRILSERLVERGYRVIVGIGVPSAEEKQRMEFHFLRDNPGAARIQLRDDDLLTYLRQIERCALYIGGDTGATHAAIHFSKPSAVLVPHEQTSVAPYGAFLPYPPALNPPGTLYTYPPEPEGTSNPATIEAITESLWRLASSHM